MEQELNAYLTSPLIDSPWEEDFLTTPALLPGGDVGIDVMASPALLDNDEAYTNAPLFGDEPLFEPLTFEKLNADRRGLVLDFSRGSRLSFVYFSSLLHCRSRKEVHRQAGNEES